MEIVELTKFEKHYYELMRTHIENGWFDRAEWLGRVTYGRLWHQEHRQVAWKRACSLLGIEIDTVPAPKPFKPLGGLVKGVETYWAYRSDEQVKSR